MMAQALSEAFHRFFDFLSTAEGIKLLLKENEEGVLIDVLLADYSITAVSKHRAMLESAWWDPVELKFTGKYLMVDIYGEQFLFKDVKWKVVQEMDGVRLIIARRWGK